MDKDKQASTVEVCPYCNGWWYEGELPKHDPNCSKLKDKKED